MDRSDATNAASPPRYRTLIVMGVSGTGKSSLGASLANSLGTNFVDGDSLHPPANLEKMAADGALDDEDRAPWLQRVCETIEQWEDQQAIGIIVCSALKRKYRDQLRGGKQTRLFLFLDGPFELIFQRLQSRQNHVAGPEMLQSQFDALESPQHEPDVVRVGIEGSPEEVANRAIEALAAANFPNQQID